MTFAAGRVSGVSHKRHLPRAARGTGGKYADLLELQRMAGNRAVTALLAAQRQPDTDQTDVPAVPDTAWIDDLDPHLQEQIDTFSQKHLDEQSAGGQQKLLDRRQRNRITFMQNLRRHLGDDAAVEAHFRAISKIDLPGQHDLWVHESTRDRLLEVKAELEAQGTPMPSTTVGQSLRGRHLHPEGAGMMTHPLGFAVDWKAYAAPHVKDPRLHALFEVVTGGPPAFHLQVGGKLLGWTARHDLIEQMGKGTADPQKAAELLASVEQEYKRLKQASADFKVSLPENALGELRAVEDARNAVAAASAKVAAAKKRRRKDPAAFDAAKEELQTAVAAFDTKKAEVQAKASTIFAPWLAKIRERRTQLDTKAAAHGVNMGTDVSTSGELSWLKKQAAGDDKRAAPLRKQAAAALARVRAAETTAVTTRSKLEAAQAWLAAPPGRQTPVQEDADRWTTDLAELHAQAGGILDEVSKRNAELAALLPDSRITPMTARAVRPAKPSDQAIALWRKQLGGAPDNFIKADERLAPVRGPLAALVASRAQKLGELAARSASNKAVVDRLEQAELAKLPGGAAAATRQQRASAQQVAKQQFASLQADRQNSVWLEKTAEALTTDINFLFKSRDVLNPGITQLLGMVANTEGGGFFTPDAEAGTSEQAKKQAEKGEWSGSHGYNLAFFKAMVAHGFELGVAWERSPDTMHFELVEGRRLAESGGSRKP
jgi:hypothetical protein